MSKARDPMYALIDRLAPVGDEDMPCDSQSAAARALFAELVACDLREASSARPVDAPPQVRASPPRRSRRWAPTALAGTIVAGLVLALMIGGDSLLSPAPAGAGVHFTTRDDFIVAKVTDPGVGRDQLRAAFAERGIDIELELVPVSPSVVGTVTSIGGSRIENIQTLEGSCVTPGGGCPIGLRIPADFRGRATIQLGRAARPGERYVSGGNAFAAGEALHCSGLHGASASRAKAELQRRGLVATWHTDDGANTVIDPRSVRGYVTEAIAVSRDQLVIWVDPGTPLAPARTGSTNDSGNEC